MGHDIDVGNGMFRLHITGNYSRDLNGVGAFLFHIYDMHRNTSDVVAIMCYCNIKWLERYWGLTPPKKTHEQIEFIKEHNFQDPEWTEKYLNICQIPYDKTNQNYFWGGYSDGSRLPFGIFLESYYNHMLYFLTICHRDMIIFNKYTPRSYSTWISDEVIHYYTPLKSETQLFNKIKNRQAKCIAYAYVYSYLHHPSGTGNLLFFINTKAHAMRAP